MKIMFVNTRERRCGVNQYGWRVDGIMQRYIGNVISCSFEDEASFRSCYEAHKPDVVIYNWQAGIGGWMGGAPFKGCGKQILLYHDLEARFSDFDAILFSDPTMPQHDNWYPIGRPVIGQLFYPAPSLPYPVVGVNGFIGAWAHHVVAQLRKEFEQCHVRFHLPHAFYGDAAGDMARSSLRACEEMMPKGFTYEVSHEFMDWEDLIRWLAGNNINCYFRDLTPWRGVSSSLDAAMCARRPIAINKCSAFRHMHNCNPSICVEDRTIRDILSSGLSPLAAKYNEYDPEVVAEQIRKVLELVVNRA